VQFLGKRDEIPQLPDLDLVHTARVSIVTQPVLASRSHGC
jgi:hypothetical protein